MSSILAALILIGVVLAQTDLFEEKIIVKEKPVQDQTFIASYKQTYQDFANVNYEAITPGTRKDLQLREGNIPEKIEGVQVAQEKIAIHLIVCDISTKSCAFRINGEATGLLYEDTTSDKPNAIAVNQDYLLKLNSITFDFCDNRRFCGSHYQAYDVVDVSLIPRGDE